MLKSKFYLMRWTKPRLKTLIGTFGLALTAGVIFIWWSVHLADRELRDALLQQAHKTVEMISPALVKPLSGSEADLISPDYQMLKQQLSRIRQMDKKSRFIYLLGRKADGKVFFYVDSEPDGTKDCSPPGQVYGEAPEGFSHVFDTRAEHIEGPYKDRWGTWVSAMVPLVDQTSGKVAAVLAMDIDARDWKGTLAAHAALPVSLTLTLLILLSSWVIISRLRAEAESERLMAAIEQSGEIILITDPNGIIQYVNAAFERITGYSSEEAIGKFPRILKSGVQDKNFYQNMWDTISNGQTWRGQIVNRRKDGTLFTESATISPVRGSAGRIVNYVAAKRDITEYNETELALQESKSKYRLLSDNIRDAFIMVDMAGRILESNQAYQDMLGYTEDELLNLTYVDLTPPRWHELESKIVAEQVLICGYSTVYEKEYRRKNGTVFPIELRTVLRKSADGKPVSMWAIVRDITERRRTEEALRMSEERYRLLFNINSDAVFVHRFTTDKRPGAFIDVNEIACKRYDYTRNELLNMRPQDLDAPEGFKDIPDAMRRLLAEGRATWEGVHVTKYGRRIPVEISNVLFEYGDEPLIMSSARDISERIHIEEQLKQAQKMESVGRLAGGVAHYFNNMLCVIIGHTEMELINMKPDHPQYARFREIHKAAKRSSDITQQLLAFARKQVSLPRVHDLNAIVTGILNIYRKLISKDVDLVWIPGENIWPIKIDLTQVNQLLTNLCVNASDAINEVGKITIWTENAFLHKAPSSSNEVFVPGEYVLLGISDNGCGMDSETLSNIFEPFFTTKEMGRNTGLGLATVYGIVRQNKGFIDASSEIGKGSTFKIYLPRHMDKAV